MTTTASADRPKAEIILPDWIRVLPLGRVELSDHREAFMVDKASLEDLVKGFRSRGVDLVIDYEHQSLRGEAAPAAGWIKDLEGRPDGLWARVDWTETARDYLQKREYRYFSPVLRLDTDTRRPTALMHLALTNVPAIKHLPPLVARWGGAPGLGEPESGEAESAGGLKSASGKEKVTMVEQLKRLMGLKPEVDEDAVCGKALEAFRDLAVSLNLPGEATVAQLQGAVEALKAGAGRLQQSQEEVEVLQGRLAQETATRVVASALKAGKVSPAQRDWALEYCRRDPEGFQTYVDRAPKLVPTGEELQLQWENSPEDRGLLPEELAICRFLKVSPAAYLEAKAQTG